MPLSPDLLSEHNASHCGNTGVGILGEVGKEHGDDKEHEDDVDG